MEPVREGPYHIVFDIDGVLGCHDYPGKEVIPFLSEKGAILTAIKTHYIFPGTIELLQVLFAEKVKVSFFSSGLRARNEVFVKELLGRAFGKERYAEIADEVAVFSREHLAQNTEENKRRQAKAFENLFGRKKKDLSVLGDDLQNTVLVDDDSSYIQCGQEKNFLFVPETYGWDFKRVERELGARFDEEGFENIRCVSYNYTLRRGIKGEDPWEEYKDQLVGEYEKKEVASGDKILLLTFGDNFAICFSDFKGGYRQLPVTKEEDPDLFHLLLEEKQDELAKEIYRFVEKRGGMIRRVCRELNRMCYLAGVLFSAMDEAKEKGVALTDVLFSWHFKKSNDGKYEQTFSQLLQQERFYRLGLKILRRANKDFSFTSPARVSLDESSAAKDQKN